MVKRWVVIAGLLASVLRPASPAAGQVRTELERDDYADHLRAMWLAQTIANWTGRRTEGRITGPPFYTDADWGQPIAGTPWTIDFVVQNPWGADDDTDIEYVYLHLMDQHGTHVLSGEQIRQGWIDHVNRFIWVSNEAARALMDRGVVPPATSVPAANQFWLRIDAQLTTEFFGCLAPGAPGAALEMADVPIGATARGHAAHASQFHVLLYCLAPIADPSLPMRERIVWTVTEARRFLPDESKAADIVDFVLADYLANPDVTDWERTRDLVYERYQAQAAANGFAYRGWTESSVNFAGGLIALLYGEGDLRRTIQIGTLSGWDSDNGTATMGGVLGLMLGSDAVEAAFPEYALSDRYDAWRTRDDLPDYLPADAAAQDTFTMMAGRMLPIVDQALAAAGGQLDAARNVWVLPPRPGEPGEVNPFTLMGRRSANNRVRAQGGTVTASSSVAASPNASTGHASPSYFANGLEHDGSGVEWTQGPRTPYSSHRTGGPAGEIQSFTVLYSRLVPVEVVRFIEGDHFGTVELNGGWFEAVTDLELLVEGQWVSVMAEAVASEPLDEAVPFQIIDFELPDAIVASGVRLTGSAGGTHGFVTIAEIDVFGTPCSERVDLDGDLDADVFDLLAYLGMWFAAEPGAERTGQEPSVIDVFDLLAYLDAWFAGC